MRLVVGPSRVEGAAAIPASKSHTLRALTIATLAEGESTILNPLESLDARSGARAAGALGARVEFAEGEWRVTGVGGRPSSAGGVVDVGNSGVTLRMMLSAAALAKGRTEFTGDEQIRRRPLGPLLQALTDLGAPAKSLGGNGCAPCEVTGPMRGGETQVACPTSQYLSSLLVSTPLAPGDSTIAVTELNEAPYVDMTLWWLDACGIRCERDGHERFTIPGGQSYEGFRREIPGDWSSATLVMAAAAVAGGTVELTGLRQDDPQGDRRVADVLAEMGAGVERGEESVRVTGGDLAGGEFDLNDIPDALPALAVCAAVAEGETRFVNVPQARIKEVDRIAALHEELAKMGVSCEELPDGLVVRGGGSGALRGARVSGRGDHRMVMALAVAGLVAAGETVIETAEAMAVTFPTFAGIMRGIGASIGMEE